MDQFARSGAALEAEVDSKSDSSYLLAQDIVIRHPSEADIPALAAHLYAGCSVLGSYSPARYSPH